jgi:hypothetical protein
VSYHRDHAFKVGVSVEEGINNTETHVAGDVNYAFRNAVPTQITQYATPYTVLQKTRRTWGSSRRISGP